MERTSVTFTRRLALAVVFSLLLSTVAWAQSGAMQKNKSGKNEQAKGEPAVAAPKADSEDAVTMVEFAGQSVAIDRKTGKLRQPTPEEARALAKGLKQLLNRSADGLKMKVQADGTKTLDLQGRFLSLAVAQRNQDGTVSEQCVTTGEEVKALQASQPEGAAKGTERSIGAQESMRRSQEVK